MIIHSNWECIRDENFQVLKQWFSHIEVTRQLWTHMCDTIQNLDWTKGDTEQQATEQKGGLICAWDFQEGTECRSR